MWEEFVETVHTKEFTPHVICKHCKTSLKHPNVCPNQSPSGMTRHLRHCHGYQQLQRAAEDHSASIQDFFTSMDPRNQPVMTADRIKDRILRIIVSGSLPFAFVENVEFVDLVKDAYPNCPVPTRRALVDHLKSKATCSKKETSARARRSQSRPSLAMDIWTTRSHLAFLGMSSLFPLPLSPCYV